MCVKVSRQDPSLKEDLKGQSPYLHGQRCYCFLKQEFCIAQILILFALSDWCTLTSLLLLIIVASFFGHRLGFNLGGLVHKEL